MYKNKLWGLRLLLVIGVVTLATACSSQPKNDLSPLQKMANRLAEGGVGAVVAVKDHQSAVPIIVFEDAHASILGNIEIAIMLNRLHQEYGVTRITSEGAFPALDVSWYRAQIGEDQEAQSIAVQHLYEGEISSVELMALLYKDVTVQGLEDRAEYESNLADAQAGGAAIPYLLAFAVQKLDENQKQQAQQIRLAQGDAAYVKYLLCFDPWSQERYQVLYGHTTAPAAEGVRVLDDVIARADEMGLTYLDDFQVYQAALYQERAFFEGVDQRTSTMFNEIHDLVPTVPGAVLPVVIGVSHTPHLVELLDQAGYSYLVLQAASLNLASPAAMLDDAAFERKFKGLSVDGDDRLGALLDGRALLNTQIMPPPSVLALHYHRKARCYKTFTLLSHLLPVTVDNTQTGATLTGLEEALRTLEPMGISIVPNSVRLVKSDPTQPDSPANQALLFQVKLPEGEDEGIHYPAETFWAKVTRLSEQAQLETLEKMLFNIRQTAENPSSVEAGLAGTTIRVSYDTRAVVGRSEEAVLNQAINLAVQ